MKRIALILVIGLVGCASTKTEMTADDYAQFAKQDLAINKCVEKGLMPPDIGSMGFRFMSNELQRRTYDSRLLQREKMFWSERAPDITSGDCNRIAMQIHQINRTGQEVTPTYVPTINPMTHTFCNKIGTQILCNSF